MNGPLFDNRESFVQDPPRQTMDRESFVQEPPLPTIDISQLGSLLAVVATDTEGTFKFQRGDLVTSPEQFFEIVRYRRAVPPS